MDDSHAVVVTTRPRGHSSSLHQRLLTATMEQKRPRPASLYAPWPHIDSFGDMSYHRTLSPGGRRLTNPARASDSIFDPHYGGRHNCSERISFMVVSTPIEHTPALLDGVQHTTNDRLRESHLLRIGERENDAWLMDDHA